MTNKNLTGTFLALALALVWMVGFVPSSLAQGPGDKSEWDFYKSAEGRFSMRVPMKPVVTTTKKDSFIGTITNHIFTVLREQNYEKFTVDYSEIPHFAVAFTGEDTIIDHAKGALLSQTMSKPISYTDVTVDGIKGKRLVYDTPPRKGHPELRGQAVFFMVGDRLYVIDAQLPMASHETKANRFLKSISVNNK